MAIIDIDPYLGEPNFEEPVDAALLTELEQMVDSSTGSIDTAIVHELDAPPVGDRASVESRPAGSALRIAGRIRGHHQEIDIELKRQREYEASLRDQRRFRKG